MDKAEFFSLCIVEYYFQNYMATGDQHWLEDYVEAKWRYIIRWGESENLLRLREK